MTQKDYIAMADRLAALRARTDAGDFGDARITRCLFDWVVEEICDFFEADSDRFKRGRFLSYLDGRCEKHGGRVKK